MTEPLHVSFQFFKHHLNKYSAYAIVKDQCAAQPHQHFHKYSHAGCDISLCHSRLGIGRYRHYQLSGFRIQLHRIDYRARHTYVRSEGSGTLPR